MKEIDSIKPYDAPSEREIRPADSGQSEALGPLNLLPGTWANIRPEHRDGSNFKGAGSLEGRGESPFDGRGWNLIALPSVKVGERRNYRLLLNQYNEVLRFKKVDDKVPNRGITQTDPPANADQLVAALDYEQTISQISAKDISPSEKAGAAELPIHHEPGFFLHMKAQNINGFDVARLATIPHGNSVTALGRSKVFEGAPTIPDLSAFPVGVDSNIEAAVANASDPESYLFPYHMFINEPFKGVVTNSGFPGFSPKNANALLQIGLPRNVKKTTELVLETDVMEAGIVNIPFIERQADSTLMKSTFWIMELDETDEKGNPKVVLAYSQFIFLDFFGRFDGREGLIRWPHISINIMEKIDEKLADSHQDTTCSKRITS